jgi:hypothetical protein
MPHGAGYMLPGSWELIDSMISEYSGANRQDDRRLLAVE